MNRPLVALFTFVAASLVSTVSSLARAECFPACRNGFVCNKADQCVSECNPPCTNGESCQKGACVLSTAETKVAKPEDIAVEQSLRHNSLAAGIESYLSTNSAAGITIAGSHVFGGEHGFLLGGRFGAYFPSGGTVGRVGIDVGYRGFFSRETVAIGMIALVQPVVYPGSKTFMGLGASVGPVLEYKRLHLELPLGVSFSEPADRLLKGSGSASSVVWVGHVGLLAGVTF